MMANRTRGTRGGSKLSRTLHESPATASQSLGGHQKEKMFLAFRICARPIFSEKGKDIFLFGVLPSKYSGRWRGFNSDSVLRKLFSGDMDFRKTETNLFLNFVRAAEGSGEESARACVKRKLVV